MGFLRVSRNAVAVSFSRRLTFHGLVAIFAIDWIVSYLPGFIPRQ